MDEVEAEPYGYGGGLPERLEDEDEERSGWCEEENEEEEEAGVEEEVVEEAARRLISNPGREELLRWSWLRAE